MCVPDWFALAGNPIIDTLCAISTWHEAPSGSSVWGFTMKEAFEALNVTGENEEQVAAFLFLLSVKVPIVPIYENEKPPE